ncbi:hypothetical protein [Streptomyces sp. Ac-502]|uniref:hypothetical protein n=1 Tax=Streptomyces sp. Ac-502 TaxID=3342801 RepID=UPI003862201F
MTVEAGGRAYRCRPPGAKSPVPPCEDHRAKTAPPVPLRPLRTVIYYNAFRFAAVLLAVRPGPRAGEANVPVAAGTRERTARTTAGTTTK